MNGNGNGGALQTDSNYSSDLTQEKPYMLWGFSVFIDWSNE